MKDLKWYCPTCNTSFEQYDLNALMEIIVDKITLNSNSLNSDYPTTEYDRLISIYNSLRHMQLKFRPKSKMMESQIIPEVPCDCFCHKEVHENSVVRDFACDCAQKDRCFLYKD